MSLTPRRLPDAKFFCLHGTCISTNVGGLGGGEYQSAALLIKDCAKKHGNIARVKLEAPCWIMVLYDEMEFGNLNRALTAFFGTWRTYSVCARSTEVSCALMPELDVEDV